VLINADRFSTGGQKHICFSSVPRPIRIYQRLSAAENARFTQFTVSRCPTNVPNVIALPVDKPILSKP
jgi:hypothetical protein